MLSHTVFAQIRQLRLTVTERLRRPVTKHTTLSHIMLEAFSRNSEIREFLGKYPTQQWKHCLEALVLIGIHTLDEETSTVEDLQRQANRGVYQSQPDLQSLRSSSAPHHRPGSLTLGKPPVVQRSIPRAPVQRWNEGTPRFKQEFVQAERENCQGRVRAGTRGGKTLPRYLQSVRSKIRGDVRKDIAYYRYQVQTNPAEPGTGSVRSSGANQHDSPAGSQLHLESLTESRPPAYLRPTDILPKPANERTFLTEPNTSLKHADELFSQLSDTSFQRPIKEETDAQVRALRTRSPLDRSQESAFSEEETGDLIHIAEDFLRDPLMAHLARKDQDSFKESSPGLETSQSRTSFRQKWEDSAQGEWEPQELYYTSYASAGGRRRDSESARRLL